MQKQFHVVVEDINWYFEDYEIYCSKWFQSYAQAIAFADKMQQEGHDQVSIRIANGRLVEYDPADRDVLWCKLLKASDVLG